MHLETGSITQYQTWRLAGVHGGPDKNVIDACRADKLCVWVRMRESGKEKRRDGCKERERGKKGAREREKGREVEGETGREKE